jgi:hypothetical protein
MYCDSEDGFILLCSKTTLRETDFQPYHRANDRLPTNQFNRVENRFQRSIPALARNQGIGMRRSFEPMRGVVGLSLCRCFGRMQITLRICSLSFFLVSGLRRAFRVLVCFQSIHLHLGDLIVAPPQIPPFSFR